MFIFNRNKSQPIKSLGQKGEEFAQQTYQALGFSIVAKNEYNKTGKRMGEIDFVAKNQEKIIFVEVKTRTEGSERFGKGEDAVNFFKQQKILRAVKIYLLKHPEYSTLVPQIDVCTVSYSQLDKSFKPAIIISNAVEDWN